MIEDIEGATSDPARRWHIVVLSALSAAVSLAVLAALVVPRAPSGAPLPAASPEPRASDRPMMTIIANPISHLRVDLTRASVCADGTLLTAPYYLAFDGSSVRVHAVRRVGSERDVGPSVPVTLVADARARWLIVSCATSGVPVPWLEFRTIPR